MSSRITDKKQQTDKSQLDADHLLNKHIFNTLAYTFGGYAAGMATSLLFKRKAGIPLIMAGAGAGYGISNLYSDMNNLQKFKGQGGSSNTLKRDEQVGTKDWGKYQQESVQSQKQPRYGGSGSDDDEEGTGVGRAGEKAKKTTKSPSDMNSPSVHRNERPVGEKPEKKAHMTKPEQMRSTGFGENFTKSPNDMNSPHRDGRKSDLGDKTEKKASLTKDEQKKTVGSGEKSHTGINPESDQRKLESVAGKGYSTSGDSKKNPIDNKKDSGKDNQKSQDSKGGKSSWFGGSSSQNKESGDKDTKKDDGKTHLTKKEGGADKSGTSSDTIIDAKTHDPYGKLLKLDDKREPGKSHQGTSEGNRRGGPPVKNVSNLVQQDHWGKSNYTGYKFYEDENPKNVAGGEFRGGSTAGSQVNAVIE